MKDVKDTVHPQGTLIKRRTVNREQSGTESIPVIRITIKKKKVFKID